MVGARAGRSVRALQRKRQAESNHPVDIARRQAAKARAKAKLAAETPEQREARLARYREAYQARKRAKIQDTAAAAAVVQQQDGYETVDTSNGTHNEGLASHTIRLATSSTATASFHRDFTDNPRGSVCERLWHANDLTAVMGQNLADCNTHKSVAAVSTTVVQGDAAMQRDRRVHVADKSTCCEKGSSKSTQAELFTLKVSRWTQSDDLEESYSASPQPELPQPGKGAPS